MVINNKCAKCGKTFDYHPKWTDFAWNPICNDCGVVSGGYETDNSEEIGELKARVKTLEEDIEVLKGMAVVKHRQDNYLEHFNILKELFYKDKNLVE